MKKPKAPCEDCNVDTLKIHEFYMVTKQVWDAVAPNDSHEMDYFLCIGCLEKRLGRELTSGDFPNHIPINWHDGINRSKRLQNRLFTKLLEQVK